MKRLVLYGMIFSVSLLVSMDVQQKCMTAVITANNGSNFWNRQNGKNEFGIRRYHQAAPFESRWNEFVCDLNTGSLSERPQIKSVDLETEYYFFSGLDTVQENGLYTTNAVFDYEGGIKVASFDANEVDAWVQNLPIKELQVKYLFKTADSAKAVLFKQAENKDKGTGEFYVANLGQNDLESLGSIFSVNALVQRKGQEDIFGPFYVTSYDKTGLRSLLNISQQPPLKVVSTGLDAQKAYMILGPSGKEAMLQEKINDAQEKWTYIPSPMSCREQE